MFPAFVVDRDGGGGTNQAAELDGVLGGTDLEAVGDIAYAVVEHCVGGDPDSCPSQRSAKPITSPASGRLSRGPWRHGVAVTSIAGRPIPPEAFVETDRRVRESCMPARIAGICGLLAFVTVNIGWIAGGLAQPAAYSVANDDISDLGADAASSSWIYNRIGANLTGLLVVALALGLWRALSPDLLGRLGAGALLVTGAGAVLDGFFHLDCRGIDTGCTNDSWHSQAHKIESGITGAATIAAPLILAFAFRRIPEWRDSWLPSLITVPAIVLANVVFSAVGNGAATRAGTVVAFLWIAFISVRLFQHGDRSAAT